MVTLAAGELNGGGWPDAEECSTAGYDAKLADLIIECPGNHNARPVMQMVVVKLPSIVS
jgi:hypothetical protein